LPNGNLRYRALNFARNLAATARRGAIQMNFLLAIASGFMKYFMFSGRASMSEYWYWVLFIALARWFFLELDATIFQWSPMGLETLFQLVTFIPTFAVDVRRLHDVDRSGWWLLLSFTIIGIFYPLLIWKITKGTEGANRFGPDPLGEDARVAEIFS
jgi:uncharacterized membrane protein YhaH (DUF805 family)